MQHTQQQQKQQQQSDTEAEPSKNVKVASKFILEQQFAIIASSISQSDDPLDQQLFEELVNDRKTNNRQKLKLFRRLLQTEQPNEQRKKIFAEKYLIGLLVKEYMYGNVENKPALMNTFKKISTLVNLSDITQNMQEMKLQTYQQARNILEMLEFIGKKEDERAAFEGGAYKEYLPLVHIIKEEFFRGSQIIKDDQFKLKWLEYFVDVLRSLNLVVRTFQHTPLQLAQPLCQHIRFQLSKPSILTKEVLTQLYLLLIFLHPQQPAPDFQNKLCLIHYLHAINVVNSFNNLPSYLQLLPTIKETQHKCQLVPLLLKSFQMYYHCYEDKQNVFDQIIPLFQVGRTVYLYLQEIIAIIIKDSPNNWSLQGNYLKKFFISTVVMKRFGTEAVLKQWPSIIRDVITQAGCMTVPYAHECSEVLFAKLFEQAGNDYATWSGRWIKEYKQCLLSTENPSDVRGIIQFINPIILSIHPSPLLLKEIIQIKKESGNSNSDLGIISLVKCFKELGKITIDNDKRQFICAQDHSIFFSADEIQQFVLSCDSMIELKALEFLTCSLKASQIVEPVEFSLILSFYRGSLKTSSPEYRKAYINATKKFFERLRIIYENELTKSQTQLKANKKYKPKQYFHQFKLFLRDLIDVCLQNIFPDAIFQIVNPSLQILQLITIYFGRKRNEYKKGQILEQSPILVELNFFNEANFQNLLICLQSSYESVRLLAHDILKLFDDFSNTSLLLKLWEQSLINANKLTIRSYEFACRTLSFISQTYPALLNLPQKYKLTQLNVCQFFLITLQQRYTVFKQQFATQQQSYYQNLIHGILTCFSYIFDDLASSIRSKPQHYQQHHSEIKAFAREFFDQMNLIITFSVEICSSNISTIVLDTLPQSQTDKKYKVDCRGHFLEEANTKPIGDFLDSTALLGSMKNEQEGIENNLVVSFYLLTRQAGLVFQSIGNLVSNTNSTLYIPSDALIQLVNTYFYALINLKHMGSVDRISTGLGKMAKVIFDNSDKSLSELPQILLNKLIFNLKEGNFTNILRRSAGVPYAFSCLLKSDALKRKHLIEKTIRSLLSLTLQKKADKIELAIHSLNILKKLFQDADLKYDLDPYVSQAFISSIKGFSSEEWGIRNSSLMLFSVLANRTVGLKPTYNLIQFFHKCPQLFEFMQTELQNISFNTMYPPLYPIVLLLSRLLPFDLKEKARMSIKGEGNIKQLRKEQLLKLLPLIQKAGRNSNFMGRVMTAKAILPFMQINKIIPHCLALLQFAFSKPIDNNLLHYYLAQALQLLLSFNQIYNSLKEQQEPIDIATLKEMLQFLHLSSKKIQTLRCPIILETLIKIHQFLFANYWTQLEKLAEYEHLVQSCEAGCKAIINEYLYSSKGFIIDLNTGHSILRNQVLQFYINLLHTYSSSPKTKQLIETYLHFTRTLTAQLKANQFFFKTADTQVIVFYLNKINAFYSSNAKEHSAQLLGLLQAISLQHIQSDGVLIGVIELRTILQLQYTQQECKWLTDACMASNNFYLKIAIFKYIQKMDIGSERLLQFAQQFSHPQQLIELRQCSVEYLQQYNKIEEKHYIISIRLLEDEEYEIRRETARIVAKMLQLPAYNEEYLKRMILQRLSLAQFELFLSQASDYQIKRKNHQEERIFSYDKPNKFRSDISNLMYLLLNNTTLKAHPKQVAGIFSAMFAKHQQKIQAQTLLLDKYRDDLMDRNEYQFQTILRLFFVLKYSEQPAQKEKMQDILCSQLQLKAIYQAYKDV